MRLTHMTLEGQSLGKEQFEYEIERVAAQIMDKMPQTSGMKNKHSRRQYADGVLKKRYLTHR